MKKSVEKGITLIALVVTIVVLLILAGISISMLTGENGVITQARKSKEQTIIGDEKEGISLAYSSCKTENMMENVTASQLEERMKADGKDVTVTQDGLDLKVLYPKTGHEYTVNQNGKIDDDSSENSDAILTGIIIDTDNVLIEKASREVVWVNNINGSELVKVNTENATVICNNGIAQKGEGYFIDEQGKVYTWGPNTYGQLGDGTTESRVKPICINDIKGSALNNKKILKICNIGASSIVARIALDSDGKVYVWGHNSNGQFGNGTTEDILIPECVSDIDGSCLNNKKIIDISDIFGLDDNGKVYEISWYNKETSKYESARCLNDMDESDLYNKKVVKIGKKGKFLDDEGKIYMFDREEKIININDLEDSVLKDIKIIEILFNTDFNIVLDDKGRAYEIILDLDNKVIIYPINNVDNVVDVFTAFRSEYTYLVDKNGKLYQIEYRDDVEYAVPAYINNENEKIIYYNNIVALSFEGEVYDLYSATDYGYGRKILTNIKTIKDATVSSNAIVILYTDFNDVPYCRFEYFSQ